MPRLLFPLLALLAFTLPAAAQQKMTWHASETDQGGALVFGVPDTEEVAIFFLCDKGSEEIIVQPMIGTKGLAKDAAARAILTAGSVSRTFAGKAVADEDGGAVNVEAKGKMADLKALAKGGKQLTIETKGAKRQVTLDGAAAAVAQFETACKAK
ncbi:hypothetical protein [Xanthobacter tagetidis]|jgi:hypothetical protein|uniref:Invasion associated locus B family protein n=1 Tax=Xanthobacter tagetidis TaxID=60216 RepID=A0A3L7AGC6_9HYPH|nr:hypothetical protein [Xanthobacter tagetidis]MBB6305945.1 hypothetical protein [Xanthobacter tagetidis]RLP78462.1 hypothetical protein D9R14_11705 [Xanthobacter tagetidis]